MADKFSLKWNDFQSNVSKSFSLLRNEDYLHDVTLVSNDHSKIKAHKLVLSAWVKYQVPMLKDPRVENDHILIRPYGKDKSIYLGVKTLENVFKMFVICF